eukprot:m.336477 g.336477  ORF g.336477 m.336477 type:complete len:527 (-) comp20537_c0_seq2:120-1700(-)
MGITAESDPLIAVKLHSDTIVDKEESQKLGKRHELAGLAFWGFFMVYAMRVNLSVAILKMKTEYEWTSSQQGMVLASFFFGYICTQIPGGYMSGKYGAKTVFGFGVLTTAVLTLITPIVAPHYPLLILVRVIEGFGEAVTYPAMMAMWGRWAPPLERSKLAISGFSGAYAGTIVSLPVSYTLIAGSFLGGWPSVFYLIGAVGVVWCVAWWWFAYDTPETHRHIRASERRYILSAIQTQQTGTQYAPVPWGALATSAPLWAIIVAHICNNWAFYTLLTGLSTYLHVALGVKTDDGGLDATLPYVSIFLTALGIGPLTDWLRKAKGVRTGVARRVNTTVAFALGASCLALTGFSGKLFPTQQRAAAVGFITVAQGGLGVAMGGFGVNHLDIGPRYSGVLMGITNTAATIPGFVGPIITAKLTPCGLCDNSTKPGYGAHWKGKSPCPSTALFANNTWINVTHGYTYCDVDQVESEWRKVFLLSAAILVFGNIFYLVFSSGNVQSWNTPDGIADSDELGVPRDIQTVAIS